MLDIPNVILRDVPMTYAFGCVNHHPLQSSRHPASLILTDAHRQEDAPLSWVNNIDDGYLEIFHPVFPLCYCLACTCCLHFLSSHLLVNPLHFQYSIAAAPVKVTDDFSIAKSSGHCSAHLTQPISSLDLIGDYCLPLERLPYWPQRHSLLVFLVSPRLLDLKLLCCPLNWRLGPQISCHLHV